MQKPRLLPHLLGDVSEKRDYIMLGHRFNFIDPRNRGSVVPLRRPRPDGFCRLGRNGAKRRHGVRRMRLDLEPDLKTRGWLPKRNHFRA